MTTSELWRTGKVYTQAPAFGAGYEVEEFRMIAIRPNETESEALVREGFNPSVSRIEIVLG